MHLLVEVVDIIEERIGDDSMYLYTGMLPVLVLVLMDLMHRSLKRIRCGMESY